MAEKLVGPVTVCASSKQKEAKPPTTIFPTTPVSSVSCERSFSALRRLKLWTRSSMTEKHRFAVMLIHRGTNCMQTPKDIYERKSNLRHIL